jgi:iron complex transport system permease protein
MESTSERPDQRGNSAQTIIQRKLLSSSGSQMLVGLVIFLIVIFLLEIGVGQVQIDPPQLTGILLSEIGIDSGIEFSQIQRDVLMIIRLPRAVLGLLIGSSLAISGASIQGMFRNPLADPGLIGISSGAAFSAGTMIVLGNTILSRVIDKLGLFALPMAAFLGGVATTILIYRLATVGGRTIVSTMLLAGIAINALATSGIGMMIFLADDAQLRDLTFWSLGSLGKASWDIIGVTAPFMLSAVLILPLLARPLNSLLLGESEAGHLGVNVERTKQYIVVIVALAVGAGVAVAGVIGFLGLVVPHLVRLIIGPDHRYVLPGSALLGGALLIGADLIARMVATSEVPIGVVTALVGGPFFLWLLIRDRNRGEYA